MLNEDEMLAFINAMRGKLDTYGHKKRKFMDQSILWLISRMKDEVVELEAAYRIFILDPTDENREALKKECADVANFAAFIHVNADDKEKYQKREFNA